MKSSEEKTEVNAKDSLYNLIFNEEDVTWQSMIYELAREGKINPWDIDISELAKEFLQALLKLKEMNFHLSGKIVLAAAILLKLKSDRLGLEQLLAITDNIDDEAYPNEDELFASTGEDSCVNGADKHFNKASLQLRIPGIRKRKVTMLELISALKQAIDVDVRRQTRLREYRCDLPEKIRNVQKVDIFQRINEVYQRLLKFIKHINSKKVTFDNILPSRERKDIVWTFVPLLHLANQGKIRLSQKQHFGQINIELYNGHRKTESKD